MVKIKFMSSCLPLHDVYSASFVSFYSYQEVKKFSFTDTEECFCITSGQPQKIVKF